MEITKRGCTIKLTGPIEPGDESRLREIIRKPLSQPVSEVWFYHTLLLDSLGGDVSEALRLATLVREAILTTSTWRLDGNPTNASGTGKPPSMPREHWPCVSACFLVWVAGAERTSWSGKLPAYGNVGIGLHRPYFAQSVYRQPPNKVAELQQAMTASVTEYLRREQISEFFIQKMLERSSREVYWLNESGDEFALNGRAPWFEEMMIARCNFDPAYDRAMEARMVRRSQDGRREDDAEQRRWLNWKQTYNACEYFTRIVEQRFLGRR